MSRLFIFAGTPVLQHLAAMIPFLSYSRSPVRFPNRGKPIPDFRSQIPNAATNCFI